MKRYIRVNDHREFVEVGLDVVLGDCLLELIDSGIAEDSFFCGPWEGLDDDELEFAINNPMIQAKMFEYCRLPIIEKMKEAIEERRELRRRSP